MRQPAKELYPSWLVFTERMYFVKILRFTIVGEKEKIKKIQQLRQNVANHRDQDFSLVCFSTTMIAWSEHRLFI